MYAKVVNKDLLSSKMHWRIAAYSESIYARVAAVSSSKTPWLKHQKVWPHRDHDFIDMLLMVMVLLAVLSMTFPMQMVEWSSEDELQARPALQVPRPRVDSARCRSRRVCGVSPGPRRNTLGLEVFVGPHCCATQRLPDYTCEL
jgi:hypothetical protein